MIKSLSYSVNGEYRNYNFPNNNLVQLRSTIYDGNSVLSVLERMLVDDYTQYYDEGDSLFGAIGVPERGSLELDCGTISYVSSKSVRRLTTKRDFHCIRYVGGSSIRSAISPMSSSEKPDSFGASLTEYSSALSISSWVRLSRIYNDLVGFDAVKMNVKERKLSIDFSNNTEWSDSALELMYLILAESFVSAHRGMRVILLSEMDCFENSAQFGKFIKALSSISNLYSIVFTNDISFADISNTCKYGVLNV